MAEQANAGEQAAASHEGQQPEAAAPRRRRGLIRWSAVLVLVVLPLAGLLVVKDRAARAAVETIGARALGLEVAVQTARLTPWSGRLELQGVRATDPARDGDEVFAAERAVADVGLLALLRGQLVIDRLELVRPRGQLTRHEDGSITLGEKPSEQPPVIEPEAPGETPQTRPEDMTPEQWRRKVEEIARRRDMVDSIRAWLRKLQRWLEERQREQREDEARRKAGRMHPSGRATYVRRERPALWIREMVCTGAEFTITDRTAGPDAQPVRFVDTRVRIANLSTRPAVTGPVEVEIEGRLADDPEAVVQARGRFEVAQAAVRSEIEVQALRLPVARLDALVRDTLPLRFRPGTVADIKLPLRFENFEIDWKPWILLDRIDVELRDPELRTIAGIDARTLVDALREVKTIELADLHIFGPVFDPEVETGDTLRRLVTEGAKRFAAEQAKRLEALARERAGEAAQKLGATETGRRLQEAAGALLGGGAQGEGGEQNPAAGEKGDGTGGLEDKGKRVLRGLLGGD